MSDHRVGSGAYASQWLRRAEEFIRGNLARPMCLQEIADAAGVSAFHFARRFKFIVFGLLLSLAWVRLRAPDVALAEAGIGAGVTGALVLDALRRLGAQGAADQTRPLRLNLPRLIGAVVTCVGAILVWLVLNVPG